MNKSTFTLNDKNEQAEELVKHTEVLSTPFNIIETEGKIFGVMGRYRMTEPLYLTEDSEEDEILRNQLYEDLTSFTWNRIVQVMEVLINDSDKIKEFIKDEN